MLNQDLLKEAEIVLIDLLELDSDKFNFYNEKRKELLNSLDVFYLDGADLEDLLYDIKDAIYDFLYYFTFEKVSKVVKAMAKKYDLSEEQQEELTDHLNDYLNALDLPYLPI